MMPMNSGFHSILSMLLGGAPISIGGHVSASRFATPARRKRSNFNLTQAGIPSGVPGAKLARKAAKRRLGLATLR